MTPADKITAADKILAGLGDAVASARCVHDLVSLPHRRDGSDVTIIERCSKCLVTFATHLKVSSP